ncbi:ATP-binding protein [Nguyenibacter vanlangensis]|uniref:histidine kinase n=2 Tax=Nguyenibacter vanlangensis TaxID=1216886 RepID=A0ABZ3D8G5_9PROT
MTLGHRLDTITGRIAMTIVVAILAAMTLYMVIVDNVPDWSRPALVDTGVLDQAATVVRLIAAMPDSQKPALAAAAATASYTVAWKAAPCSPGPLRRAPEIERRMRRLAGGDLAAVGFYVAEPSAASPAADARFNRAPFGMAVTLRNGACLIFTVPHRVWGLSWWKRDALMSVFVILATVCVSTIASRTLIRPIEEFSRAARRFGRDTSAPPMVEYGPRELRLAMRAFNAMQDRISKFVADRTTMLAAISHDLRTPLTRIRLRGEFIADREQQKRLFQDVAEMQAMISSALVLFRDDVTDEQGTSFDLSELVRDVVDDAVDQGKPALFSGPDHVIFHGRPMALKRALENIIGNACIYGASADVRLHERGDCLAISVADDGPGIPEEFLEAVFTPFFRLERSRNRRTGGTGLGLTSCRAILQAHGGSISLSNRADGGLLAQIILPRNAAA